MITAQILTCFGQKMQNSLFELFLICLRFSTEINQFKIWAVIVENEQNPKIRK